MPKKAKSKCFRILKKRNSRAPKNLGNADREFFREFFNLNESLEEQRTLGAATTEPVEEIAVEVEIPQSSRAHQEIAVDACANVTNDDILECRRLEEVAVVEAAPIVGTINDSILELRQLEEVPLETVIIVDNGDIPQNEPLQEVPIPMASASNLNCPSWKEVENLVKIFFPTNYFTQLANNCLSVTILSKNENAVAQRSIHFLCDGTYNIYVHRKPLSKTHAIWKQQLPPLGTVSAREMCDQIVSKVKCLSEYCICVGAPEEQLEPFWSTTPNTHPEEDFHNFRFKKTLRSNSCEYLVSAKTKRCAACRLVYRALQKRFSRASKVEKRTPSKFKPYKYLTPAQLEARRSREKKVNRNAKLLIDRLLCKLNEKVECEGVDLDLDLNHQLKQILDQTKLTEFQKIFIESQVRCATVSKKCGMKWHPAMIRFALNLRLHSSSTYDVAQRYIELPSERTLYDYSHVNDIKDGVSLPIIENICDNIDTSDSPDDPLSSFRYNHMLSFDEVHISQNLVFHKETGVMVGYCKLNESEQEILEMERCLLDESAPLNNTPPVAKSILSFLVSGIFSPLKEVVASFCVGTLSKEFLYERHWQVVETLETCGIKVCGSVCDGASVNRSFIQMHVPATPTRSKVVFDTYNLYSADKRKFYFLSDPPHLLKCIRNCLESKSRKLQKNNEALSWSTIQRLYHETKNFTIRKTYKLDAQCVFLNSYSRMKVAYAARVLSRSVANELRRRGWGNTKELIKFIELVNDFFDILNGSYHNESLVKKNPLLAPYYVSSDERLSQLDSFLDYLSEWKTEVEDLKKKEKEANKNEEGNIDKDAKFIGAQLHVGIEITVRSFQGLIKELLPATLENPSEPCEKYIMARVFNQDSLEQYFSRQRARCGGSRNPNAAQYFQNQNSLHIIGQVGGLRKKANTKSKKDTIRCDDTPVPKRKGSSRCLSFPDS